MQVLSHTFTYFSTVTLDIEALVVPWHQFTYSLLVPDGRQSMTACCRFSPSVNRSLARCSFTFEKR
jgi:hypothetical protein